MRVTRRSIGVLCYLLTLCVVTNVAEAADSSGGTTATGIAASGSDGATGFCDEGCCESICSQGCSGGCQDDCCQSNCFDQQRFLGLLPSDHAFDSFISPLSNPFFFEDPRSLTEARTIFLYNRLPNSVGPGGVVVWAEQIRGRLTERLSLIAPRLGDMNIQTPGNSSGFMSAPVGFKYNLVRDVQSQFLVSAGMTYFIEGSNRVYQGFDDGDFHLFLTGGKRWGNAHWISGSGFRLPSNHNYGNQMWYWSNQWDYQLPGNIYPLIGLNWFHFMRSSSQQFNGAPSISGLDLVNLPFGAVAGTNVVTCPIGLRWKPTRNFEFGGGWEFPVTNRQDILGNRTYVDVIFRY
jgi:hypothetical protein